MPNFADKIADIITGLAVQLERAKAGQVRFVNGRLGELGRSIVDIIRRNEQGLTGPYSTESRRQAVYHQATDAIGKTYNGIRHGWPTTLTRISKWFTERTANDINRAAGVPLYKRITDKQIQRISEQVLIEGAPSSAWWSKQNAALKDKFIRQMREGVAANETVDQLAKRIINTKSMPFRSGIMKQARLDAEALVRTSVQAAANQARLQQYESSDAVNALQQISTLDSRTTLICISRDNLMWTKDTKKPIGGHNKTFMVPPLHFSCRSTLIGLIKSADELERDGLNIPDSTRASMDGQVSAELNYEQWLRTKPASFQRDVLGRKRWELWQDGKLPFSMLIDQSNRPLTVAELERLI